MTRYRRRPPVEEGLHRLAFPHRPGHGSPVRKAEARRLARLVDVRADREKLTITLAVVDPSTGIDQIEAAIAVGAAEAQLEVIGSHQRESFDRSDRKARHCEPLARVA